ncbi:unnamed protein product [Amoebophrya sp. A120]|nr:unnamed protein product [Amoebophrya sp. A120]|eukprot:GSA120T00007401001.1
MMEFNVKIKSPLYFPVIQVLLTTESEPDRTNSLRGRGRREQHALRTTTRELHRVLGMIYNPVAGLHVLVCPGQELLFRSTASCKIFEREELRPAFDCSSLLGKRSTIMPRPRKLRL